MPSGGSTHVIWMWIWIAVVAVAWIAFFAYLASRIVGPTQSNREGPRKRPSDAGTREEELGKINASESATKGSLEPIRKRREKDRAGNQGCLFFHGDRSETLVPHVQRRARGVSGRYLPAMRSRIELSDRVARKSPAWWRAATAPRGTTRMRRPEPDRRKGNAKQEGGH